MDQFLSDVWPTLIVLVAGGAVLLLFAVSIMSPIWADLGGWISDTATRVASARGGAAVLDDRMAGVDARLSALDQRLASIERLLREFEDESGTPTLN